MRPVLYVSLLLALFGLATAQEVPPHHEPEPPAAIEPIPEPPPTLESVPPVPHLAGPACLETSVHRLRHAQAADVAAYVDAAFREKHAIEAQIRGLVVESKIVLIPEPVSNSLIVTALPEFLPELRDLIEKADRPPRQYVIQARMTRTDGQGHRMIIAQPKLATVAGRPATVTIRDSQGRGYELELVIEDLGRAGTMAESQAEPPHAVTAAETDTLPKEWTEITVRPKARSDSQTVEESEDEIKKKLQEKAYLHFDDVPLKDAVRQIAARADVNMVLDNRGLMEAGITADQRVAVDARDVPLHEALRRLLQPLQLGFRAENEVLKITSRMRSRGPLSVSTYPVADLAVQLRDGQPRTDLSALIQTLESRVHPDSWDKRGGPAMVRAHEQTLSLIVRQSEDGHREIAKLLEQERRSDAEQPTELQVSAIRRLVPPPAVVAVAGDDDVQKKLEQTVSLDFVLMPLSSVVPQLARITGLGVVLDMDGLRAADASPETRVTLQVQDVPLRSALQQMLDPVGLRCVVDHGLLRIVGRDQQARPLQTVQYSLPDIQFLPAPPDAGTAGVTTPAQAEPQRQQAVQTYDVADLVAPGVQGSDFSFHVGELKASGDLASIELVHRPGFDWLVSELQKACSPATWSQTTVDISHQALTLGVQSSPEGHAEIARCLEQIRRIKNRFASPEKSTGKSSD